MPRFEIYSNLPGCFHLHPRARTSDIHGEFEVRMTRHAKLRAKVLVFANRTALRRFWRDVLKKPELGRDCAGAVTALLAQAERYEGKRVRIRVLGDARYFCIVGLARGWLTPEVICHEAVHAGFAYSKRVARSPFAEAHELDEERVAYPAGIIAATINQWLHDNNMHDRRKEAPPCNTD